MPASGQVLDWLHSFIQLVAQGLAEAKVADAAGEDVGSRPGPTNRGAGSAAGPGRPK